MSQETSARAADKLLGNFRILRELGRGGMGVVHLATDTRLNREVAIKSLPEHLAADAERLARFEREARTLASLNHPNVAGIYGVEEQDGRRYLILEYVEGQTLAERLDRGPLAIDEALEVGAQIAAGVEAAHTAGVIHRDLKPANVKITPEGKVKVLDFGLAKATEGASSSSSEDETLSSPARHSPTMPGVILGTAAYMSPEQARGRPVDKRTDIWSFGVVLYECLTGANPFIGESVTDSIGAILHKDMDFEHLPAQTAPTVRLLLRRCLAKDRGRRLNDIGDARLELEEALTDPAGSGLGLSALLDRGAAARGRGGWTRSAIMVAALLLTGVAGLLTGRRLSDQTILQVRKYEIPLAQNATWNAGQPAISPDGSMIAYVDDDRIWIRRLDSFDARAVEESEQAVMPFWSPDSRWLGFARGHELLKAPATGGRPVVITRVPDIFTVVAGAVWSSENRIFFSTGHTGVLVVSADGGEPRTFVGLEPDDDDFHEVALLPDGKSVVFTVHSRSRPWYLGASDGQRRTKVLALDQHYLMSPTYSPTGHILYQRAADEQSVWALPFSEARLEATGAPFLVARDDGDPSLSDNGVLVVTKRIRGLAGGDLVRLDLSSGTIDGLASPQGLYHDPALSPDGKTMAVAGFGMAVLDIWLLELEQGTRTRITFDDATHEVLPRWSPDGREIALAKTTASTFERFGPKDTIHFFATDGSGETRPSIRGGYPTLDRQWNHLAFVRVEDGTGEDIYHVPLDGSSDARPILQSDASESQPALSPDGQWLAYTSNESGAEQVFLTRFPSGQGKWQVSPGRGGFPRWSPDGTRLYFIGSNVNILEVRLTVEPRVMLSQPRSVMQGPVLGINPYMGFDFTPDGGGLIVIQTDRSKSASGIGVIENWYEEFRHRGAE